MELEFYKYQGTGNDFVIIDNRSLTFPKNNTKLVAQLCDRKFGVGADGLLLLEPNATAHFTMVYYNADGNESTMCGNGGRCIAHFAHFLGIVGEEVNFEAIDGLHTATIDGAMVSLKMNDVTKVELLEKAAFLNTGSPHHVALVAKLNEFPVVEVGRSIRNERYGTAGANVNFVQGISNDHFEVRTYERGVEDETLSCGTGVTAVAIAMHAMGETSQENIQLDTPGGTLEVSFSRTALGYQEVYLKGPATQVFKGIWK